MISNKGVCCVELCKTGKVDGQELMCHEFPEQGETQVLVKRPNGEQLFMDRREVWKGIVGVDWVSKDVVVCARHFRSSDYTMVFNNDTPQMLLRQEAVPTCNIPGRSHVQVSGSQYNHHVNLESQLIVNGQDETDTSQNTQIHSQEEHQPENLSSILAGITNDKYKERLTNLHILNEIHNYCAFRISNKDENTETSDKQTPHPQPPQDNTVKLTKTSNQPQIAKIRNTTEATTHNIIQCSVPGCASSSKTDTTLLFHRFPERGRNVTVKSASGQRMWMDRRDLWRAMLRTDSVLEWIRVCSNHFLKTDYTSGRILKYDAFPTRNLPNVDQKSEKVQRLSGLPRSKNSAFPLFKPETELNQASRSVLKKRVNPVVISRLPCKSRKINTKKRSSLKQGQSVLESLLQRSNSDTCTSQERISVEAAILNEPVNTDVITIEDDEMLDVKTELITIEEEEITGIDYEPDAFLNQIDMFTSSVSGREVLDLSNVEPVLNDYDDMILSSCVLKKRKCKKLGGIK